MLVIGLCEQVLEEATTMRSLTGTVALVGCRLGVMGHPNHFGQERCYSSTRVLLARLQGHAQRERMERAIKESKSLDPASFGTQSGVSSTVLL